MDLTDSQRLQQRTDTDWMAAHWMPYTGNRDFKCNPRMMASASGAYYTMQDGKKVFDGLSGLWCSGLGHGRKEVAEAIGKAAAKAAKEGTTVPEIRGSFDRAAAIDDISSIQGKDLEVTKRGDKIVVNTNELTYVERAKAS